MKLNIASKILFFFFIWPVLLMSCETLDRKFFPEQSWYMNQYAPNGKKIKGSFALLGVTVDRSGGRDSIQKEAEDTAPLYFWREGYCLSADNATADYAADIRLREREYISSWRTKRSVSVEVRIFDLQDNLSRVSAADIGHTFPLAVGRALSSGGETLSSSQTTSRMLALAVKRAVRDLGWEKRRR